MLNARGYIVKAKQCEERARRVRDLKDKDWQMVLARAYRMLAEAATEAAAQKNARTARKMPNQSHALTSNVVPAL
jgi:hypothetical protein